MEKQTWKDFIDSGWFWWINMILHTVGWCIVMEKDTETGEITSVPSPPPAKVKWRGFEPEDNDEGYKKVTQNMADSIGKLKKDVGIE